MDPATFAVSVTAEYIFNRVLDEVSGRVRRNIISKSLNKTILETYRVAIEAFIRTIPEEAVDYIDVFEVFFQDDLVIAEFALLLDPAPDAELNVNALRDRLGQLGLDFTTIPAFSFDRAVQALASAFTNAAANDAELRSILSYQTLQRMDAKLTTIVALLDESPIAVEQRIDQWIAQEEHINADMDADTPLDHTPRAYRYTSQQIIRYIGFGTSEAFPPQLIPLLQTLAMTRDNWVSESDHTVELTMSSADFILIFEALNRVKENLPQEEMLTSAVFMRALANVVTQELKRSIILKQSGQRRSAPESVHQMIDAGFAYLIIGVDEHFAGLFEVLQTAIYPSGVPKIDRSEDEVFFESLEDSQEVFSLLQDFSLAASSNDTRAIEILIEGMMTRGINRAISEIEETTGEISLQSSPAVPPTSHVTSDPVRNNNQTEPLEKLRNKPQSRKAQKRKQRKYR